MAEVVPLGGDLPPHLARAARLAGTLPRLRPADARDLRASVARLHHAAQLGRPMLAARWMLVRRKLAAAGALDAIVQRGCEMRLPGGHPVVTLEDSTVLQAWESYPWPHLAGLDEGDIRRYADRQRAAYESALACCCATHWVADSIRAATGYPPSACSRSASGRTTRPASRPSATGARRATCSSAPTGAARTATRSCELSRASARASRRPASTWSGAPADRAGRRHGPRLAVARPRR